MKKVTLVTALILNANLCGAEPGQIDKTSIVASITATSAVRDGFWLKGVCEEYTVWQKEPGTLWKQSDTKKENLGAGLCAGFITGITNAPGISSCVSKHTFEPEKILDFLQKHSMRLGESAGQLVVDALSADDQCR